MTRFLFLTAVVGTIATTHPLHAQEAETSPEPVAQVRERPHPDKVYLEDRGLTGGFFRKLRRIRASEDNAAAAARIPGAWQAYSRIRVGDKWTKRKAFDEWGFWVWNEAQDETGKDDPEWCLMLYRALYDLAKTEKRFDWVTHVRSNVVVSYSALCQWAKMREVSNEGEDYFSRMGFGLDPGRLPDMGEWDSSIPFVRKRDFPLIVPNSKHVVYWHRKEQRDPTQPSMMDNLLVAFINNLSGDDLDMGRWDRSIERSLWIKHWGDEVLRYNEGKNKTEPLRRDHEDMYRRAAYRIGSVLTILQCREKALELVNEGIERKGRSACNMKEHTWLEIMRDGLTWEPGKDDAGLLERMDKAIALEGSPNINKGDMDSARSLKANCLIAMGRLDEAEAILREICERRARKLKGWLGAELDLVDLHLTRGEFDRVEGTLRELMVVLRVKGVKMDEFDLYRKFVKWAMLSGNWDEALRAQREVMRLLEAFRMTPLLPLEQARLSRIMAELGNAGEADRLVALAKSGLDGRDKHFVRRLENEIGTRKNRIVAATEEKVMVQPTRVVSMALEKFPSRAVVSLVNHGKHEATGFLKVKGLPASISWDQATGTGVVEVASALGNSVERMSGKIQIQAGAMAIFSCSGELADEASKTVILEWVGQGKNEQRCEWIIEADDKESDGAVIDAAEYKDDPFFMIPVHHHLQSKGKGPVNLRVVTSQPCRVEMYDNQGTLQMVDAEGNGSLKDSGDWLGVDRDRDLSAELLPDESTGETRFFLQLDPKDWRGGEALDIRVEWLVDGKWYLAAEDKILAAK